MFAPKYADLNTIYVVIALYHVWVKVKEVTLWLNEKEELLQAEDLLPKGLQEESQRHVKLLEENQRLGVLLGKDRQYADQLQDDLLVGNQLHESQREERLLADLQEEELEEPKQNK